MDRRASTASQDTFISLQQLDPSPIDTPPELEKQLEDYPPSPPSAPKISATLGLSGSGHSSVYYCNYPFMNYLNLTNQPSNASAKVLLLRVYDIRLLPHHQYI